MCAFFDTPGVFMDDPGLFYDDDSPLPRRKKMKKKIKLGLDKKSIPEKIAFGDQVITKLTGNASLPDSAEALAAFSAVHTQFKSDYAALLAAKTTAQEKKSTCDTCHGSWDDSMRSLALAVEYESDGSAPVIQSGGFELRGLPVPVGTLDAPANLMAATNGLEGVMRLRWEKVHGAMNYVVERTLNPLLPEGWQQVGMPTASSFEDVDLTPGTKYFYRVAANGADGLGGWSDVTWKMAV